MPFNADIPKDLQQVRESHLSAENQMEESKQPVWHVLSETLVQCNHRNFHSLLEPSLPSWWSLLIRPLQQQKGLSVHWGNWRRTCAPPWKRRVSMALHSCSYTGIQATDEIITECVACIFTKETVTAVLIWHAEVNSVTHCALLVLLGINKAWIGKSLSKAY